VSRSPSSDARFRRIYDLNVETVQRYCARRLKPSDANDAVADVFLVVWRRLDDVPSGEDTIPWLLGVARNAVKNLERSRRRALRLSSKVARYRETADAGPDVQIVRASELEEVAAAFDSLSSNDQEIIRLKVWEELTAREIAVVFNISVAAAEKRASRATARLAKAASSNRIQAGTQTLTEGGGAS
jgi:RNA polymerase sigma factor (sigma-70 family)